MDMARGKTILRADWNRHSNWADDADGADANIRLSDGIRSKFDHNQSMAIWPRALGRKGAMNLRCRSIRVGDERALSRQPLSGPAKKLRKSLATSCRRP